MENRPSRPGPSPVNMRPGAPRPQHHSTPHAQQATAPQPPRPAAPPIPPKKSKAGFIVGLVCLVAIALVITGAGIVMLTRMISTTSAVKSSGYQAVFLTNNMVYFGKITDISSEYVKLSDIFYLQVQGDQSKTQANSTTQPQLSLTKLGGELHGPEDTMYINRKEILFWENLKADGKVTQAIKDYQGKNGK